MILPTLLLSMAATTPIQQAEGSFVVEGRLEYIDGDRLFVACGRRQPCLETLIRDERLQRDILTLQGRRLRLRVERVAACGPQSSGVACLQSKDRTALRILEWLPGQVRH